MMTFHIIQTLVAVGTLATLLATAIAITYRPNRAHSHRRYWKRQDRKEQRNAKPR